MPEDKNSKRQVDDLDVGLRAIGAARVIRVTEAAEMPMPTLGDDGFVPSLNDVRKWLVAAKDAGATHVIIVRDTFSNEDWPVDVTADQDVRMVYQMYEGHVMHRVLEVYRMDLDLEEQLAERRAMHF